MRGCAFAALAACASSSPPEAQPPVPAPVAEPSTAASRPARPATAPVRWANIETVENCFYFSGPFNGRDENLRGRAELAVDGPHAILKLGSATFDGTVDGEALSVKRASYHEFEVTWKVTETITGTVHDGELRASYRYEECGEGACPGRCTMTADLSGPVQRMR